MTIRVLVVDDHPVVVDGLRAALAGHADLEVMQPAPTLAAAREALAEPVDVVICDVRLPDGTGFELLEHLGGRDGGPAVLMISSFDAPQYVDAARRLGARGFLLKTAPSERIVDALRRVHAGDTAFDRVAVDAGAHSMKLTPRERDVVAAVVRGRSNDEASAELGISRKTVEAHLSRIYERTGAASRTELALMAERGGWLDVPT